MVLKSIYFMFFVCVFLFGMMACSSKPKDKFTNLSSDEFERLIEDRNVQRLDVRTVAEYSEGHIPGSININILDDNFSSAADEVLDKSLPVAVYCPVFISGFHNQFFMPRLFLLCIFILFKPVAPRRKRALTIF